nr:MAG TPA: hypothetical protein [Caudoviricetes sp.]
MRHLQNHTTLKQPYCQPLQSLGLRHLQNLSTFA